MVRIRRMDATGHSCLADSNGCAVWNEGETEVSLPFAQEVVDGYLDKGYFLVDEDTKLLINRGEMSTKSAYLLMPPVMGG